MSGICWPWRWGNRNLSEKKHQGHFSRPNHWECFCLGMEVSRRQTQKKTLDFSLGSTIEGGSFIWMETPGSIRFEMKENGFIFGYTEFEVPTRHFKAKETLLSKQDLHRILAKVLSNNHVNHFVLSATTHTQFSKTLKTINRCTSPLQPTCEAFWRSASPTSS